MELLSHFISRLQYRGSRKTLSIHFHLISSPACILFYLASIITPRLPFSSPIHHSIQFMELKIPTTDLHCRPQLPFLNRHRTHNPHCKLSRSVVCKRAAMIRSNLDSIFEDDDEFRKRTEFRFNMEQKANRVDIPFSIRIIKRKNQWKQGIQTYCSVKKAFSSMVFIIGELQSFSLQMRQKQQPYRNRNRNQNLQGIIDCVQREMRDSFVWLFQQVFSHTPSLMVSLMILLANYSVHSMSTPVVLPAMAVVAEHRSQGKFDSNSVKSFSVSSSSSSGAKTASVGGTGGGGGKLRPAARGADDGSAAARSYYYLRDVFTEKESSMDEDSVWNSMVEEALRMRGELGFDGETVRWFVSPVRAVIEEDDYYSETEMMYRAGIATDPNNSMLLANFAQFLYLVARDFDRAEVFFKKASNVTPLDAEALNKYANFLWHARNDISAAEQTYLAAVSASPSNSNYAAIYAHFLWSTGGEETCNPSDQTQSLQ